MSHLNLKSLKVIVCDFSPVPMFSIISLVAATSTVWGELSNDQIVISALPFSSCISAESLQPQEWGER